VLLFTGAVWNMAFSFYSSLKSIPRELREAADINRFSWLQRLVQLELPFAAIGLVWNSVMSVAGAWFTLMACEMFHFGTKDFRLPGLGSYLQTAADQKDGKAIAWGLITMIAIIVAIDQLIWRPLIAWSDKFKFEQVESSQHVHSPLLHLFTHSNVLAAIARRTAEPLNEAIYIKLAARRKERLARAAEHPRTGEGLGERVVLWALLGLAGAGILMAAQRAVLLVRPVTARSTLSC
jgi:NitT/TauT family transport system permease protein